MANKKILTVDEILGAPDLTEETVEVPEWGGTVKVRGLTKAAQQNIRRQATSSDGEVDPDHMEALMLATCIAEPQFTEEQVEQLRGKSAAAVDRVLRAIINLAGLAPEVVGSTQKSFRAGVSGAE